MDCSAPWPRPLPVSAPTNPTLEPLTKTPRDSRQALPEEEEEEEEEAGGGEDQNFVPSKGTRI